MGVATFLVPAQVNAVMGIPAWISHFRKVICRAAGIPAASLWSVLLFKNLFWFLKGSLSHLQHQTFLTVVLYRISHLTLCRKHLLAWSGPLAPHDNWKKTEETSASIPLTPELGTLSGWARWDKDRRGSTRTEGLTVAQCFNEKQIISSLISSRGGRNATVGTRYPQAHMGQEAADDIIIVHLQHLEASAKIKDKISLVLFTVKTSTRWQRQGLREWGNMEMDPTCGFQPSGPGLWGDGPHLQNSSSGTVGLQREVYSLVCV